MSARTLLLIAALCAVGWWYSPLSPRVPSPPAPASGATPGCPAPPAVTGDSPPLQSALPAGMPPFRLQAATLQPLAGISIDARVLSREDYAVGREAVLSPTDLALGWQRMRDPTVLAQLEISQSARWYRYRWRDAPPLPPPEIARSSANMHLIPADAAVARALRRVRAGEDVRIDGWLVAAEAEDGWRWRSSLSRDDTGNGACELVYVCALVVR